MGKQQSRSSLSPGSRFLFHSYTHTVPPSRRHHVLLHGVVAVLLGGGPALGRLCVQADLEHAAAVGHPLLLRHGDPPGLPISMDRPVRAPGQQGPHPGRLAHICLQPLFTHVINSSLTRSKTLLSQYKIIYRLCVLSGMMLFSRSLLAEFGGPTWVKQPVISSYDNFTGIAPPENGCGTAEWLRGSELCTYSGKYHLAWSVPMADATYWVPAASTHSFMMFAPFFVLKWDRANSLKEYLFRGMAIQGFFLWLAGPYLASWITPNLQEQASIWCFFSIAQITIMLFIIREQLILGWGRDKDVKNRISVMSAGKEAVKAGKAH